jgi:hypothetical protein
MPEKLTPEEVLRIVLLACLDNEPIDFHRQPIPDTLRRVLEEFFTDV